MILYEREYLVTTSDYQILKWSWENIGYSDVCVWLASAMLEKDTIITKSDENEVQMIERGIWGYV